MPVKVLRAIVGDFVGLIRVGGIGLGVRWLIKVPLRLRQCAAARSLQPVDRAMGEGPFRLALRGASAQLVGAGAISGAREIWVRDVYLHGGFLSIPPAGVVVDLGANMGVFTALALGHGPGVRVIAVEADPRECRKLAATVQQNHAGDRVTIVKAFIGGNRSFQQHLRADVGDSAPHLSESELVERCNLSRIDLLKCDIEGAEFDLLRKDSRLLAMSDQIALELHPNDGDPRQVLDALKSAGFELLIEPHPPTLIVLGRRPSAKAIG